MSDTTAYVVMWISILLMLAASLGIVLAGIHDFIMKRRVKRGEAANVPNKPRVPPPPPTTPGWSSSFKHRTSNQ